MISNSTAAPPLAAAMDPRCGAAFPRENEPIITQKNTCKIDCYNNFSNFTHYYYHNMYLPYRCKTELNHASIYTVYNQRK